MTLDRAVAILAAHLGEVDEDKINRMSYVFFDDVLTELGHRLNFEAISHYAGNSFCEKSWDMIIEHNPFKLGKHNPDAPMKALAGFFTSSKIMVMDKQKEGQEHG